MYGELLLDRFTVKFLCPAPLHLEICHMLSTFHCNALGNDAAICITVLRMSNDLRQSRLPVKRMNITLVRGGNMVVLSSSISAKVSKMSYHECKGNKWQCPTTQSPTQQHNEPQRKIMG